MERQKLCKMVLNKGVAEGSGRTMQLWDVVKECSEECPAYGICEYRPTPAGRCTFMHKYLQSIIDGLLAVEKELTDDQLKRFGFMVLPLYQQLIMLKIETVPLKSAIIGKGVGSKVHPVYKEIREVIKAIDAQLDKIGVSIPVKEPESPEDAMDMEEGDPGYYERITLQAESSNGKKIRKRGYKH